MGVDGCWCALWSSKPASDLVDETLFWQNQQEGLAVFITQGEMNYYHIPFEVKEKVIISNKFHTKPLLPLFSIDGQFYILALSKNDLRLFKASRQLVKEIKMKNAPKNMLAMKVDDDPRTNLLIKTSSPRGKSELRYDKVTQGQAVENDFERNELTRYFRAIDESLNKVTTKEKLPLVLAGVEYLIPIYKEISNYPNILDEFIKGNPEMLAGDDLQKMAWEIIEPKFLKIQELAEAKYMQYSGQGNKLFSNSLKKILPQAYRGQVASLFIANEIDQWGEYDLETNKVKLHDEEIQGSEELMERAAILTISRGGDVFAVDSDKVPDNGIVAAVLRY